MDALAKQLVDAAAGVGGWRLGPDPLDHRPCHRDDQRTYVGCGIGYMSSRHVLRLAVLVVRIAQKLGCPPKL